MDWAMKIATDFESRWGVSYDPYYDTPGDGFTFDADEFAAALRKAKADGMREAAVMMREKHNFWLSSHQDQKAVAASTSAEDFEARASEIEKGNP